MQHQRPVNLKLTSIHFPITAIVSIFHRLSGVFLFLCIPLLLWFFQGSLHSEMYFNMIQCHLSLLFWKVIVWLFFSALIYHVIAGVRHLLMDMHIGDGLCGGRLGAWIVFFVSAILILTLAGFMWGVIS